VGETDNEPSKKTNENYCFLKLTLKICWQMKLKWINLWLKPIKTQRKEKAQRECKNCFATVPVQNCLNILVQKFREIFYCGTLWQMQCVETFCVFNFSLYWCTFGIDKVKPEKNQCKTFRAFVKYAQKSAKNVVLIILMLILVTFNGVQ
jgi:hypothetical protein